MTAVDPLFAQWLQAPADYVLRTDGIASPRWGTTALATERVTGLATRTGAEEEAARQLAFFERGPFAIEEHQLSGTDWQRELGRVITVAINELGYDTGLDVYVVGVDANRATGLSTVTVIRPLRSPS